MLKPLSHSLFLLLLLLLSFLLCLPQMMVISHQMDILLFKQSNLCQNWWAFSSQDCIPRLCVFNSTTIWGEKKLIHCFVSIIWVISCGNVLWSERICMEFNYLYCFLKQDKNLGFLSWVHSQRAPNRFNKIENSSSKHSSVAGFVHLSEESTCALILHFDPLCKPFCLVLQMPRYLL